MYQSILLIDVGNNPDRPRPGRMWLRNPYHIHQRLSMAFPTKQQSSTDPNFLMPFAPSAFNKERILFRVEHGFSQNESRQFIIVQTVNQPEWHYAFQNVPFLAAPPQCRCIDDLHNGLTSDMEWHFKLRANVTKKSNGKRINFFTKAPNQHVTPEELALIRAEEQNAQIGWLHRKAKDGGFELIGEDLKLTCEYATIAWRKYGNQGENNTQFGTISKEQQRMTFSAVTFQGTLRITDADQFRQTLRDGIGSAKGFGFGLLSLYDK